MRVNRRTFLKNSALTGAFLTLPRMSIGAPTISPALPADSLMSHLLQDWGEALLKLQIRQPDVPALDGAYRCPACGTIHGRCGDSVYPLLYLAQTQGDARYVEAALRAMQWTKNVEAPEGAWTNDTNKNSWKGITVFAAIAQAEALHHHGQLIEAPVRARWLARLRLAAEYIYANVNMAYGNINYPISAAYAMALLARTFDDDKYRVRGRELAQATLKYFTPNGLLFGEGHPADQRSPKGCLPVDLGYNVEESLPSLAMYGLLENDTEVLEPVTTALAAHLEFMLPDGGWDNSWGTRSYKWTYWGSRTSDGCQAAYALLADRHPAFATAARRNVELLRRCTHDGLLYGGPHYFEHQVPACVHHTFCHAKALTTVLNQAPKIADASVALPRETAVGVREFPEINTFLAAQGPWRATVTGYDWLYHDSMHATGGSLALLYHQQFGTLCAASLAKYLLVEADNMQPLPDNLDFPLTPRLECRTAEGWFTNLYDLTAKTAVAHEPDGISFQIQTRLVDERRREPESGAMNFRMMYRLTADACTLRIEPEAAVRGKWSLVLPLVSAQSEPVRRLTERSYEVVKPGGRVIVEADSPLRIQELARARAFNLVPGFQAVPFVVDGNDPEVVTLDLRAGA